MNVELTPEVKESQKLHETLYNGTLKPEEETSSSNLTPETFSSNLTPETFSSNLTPETFSSNLTPETSSLEATLSAYDSAPIVDHGAGHQQNLSRSMGVALFSSKPQSINKDRIIESARYNVQNLLGEGSFGEVWRAFDEDLERSVAIKWFKGSAERGQYSCKEEIRFLGRLDHPNIPPIYDARLSDQGTPYIVMKELKGEPLSEVILRLKRGDLETHEKYPFIKRVKIIVQVLHALSKAHQVGILHRDIKPDNIFIGSQGETWLIDWGVAIELAKVKDSSTLSGTPIYMSPEQTRCDGLTFASDLFSVGAVAYELLGLSTASPQRQTIQELLYAIPTYQPPRLDHLPHQVQGNVPSEISWSIMLALSIDSNQRYQTAEKMIHALERVLSGYIMIQCPRTLIKHHLFNFSRWLDRSPHKNVLLFYLSILLLFCFILLLGILLGYLI
jgi:eukaryotic-like serine/threonine-protein kinase